MPRRSRNGYQKQAGVQLKGGSELISYFVSGDGSSEVGILALPQFERERFARDSLPLRDWTDRPNVIGPQALPRQPELQRLAQARPVGADELHPGEPALLARVELRRRDWARTCSAARLQEQRHRVADSARRSTATAPGRRATCGRRRRRRTSTASSSERQRPVPPVRLARQPRDDRQRLHRAA